MAKEPMDASMNAGPRSRKRPRAKPSEPTPDPRTMTDEECLALLTRPALTVRQLSRMVGRSPTINSQIASHPSASPALLKRLAGYSERGTLANITANPNTLRETLLRPAAAYTDEFILNPAFDWLLMEDPTLLQDKLRPMVLMKIFRRSDCPPSFIAWALQHGTARQQLAVVNRPDVTEQALQVLARSAHAEVAELARGRLMGSSQGAAPKNLRMCDEH